MAQPTIQIDDDAIKRDGGDLSLNLDLSHRSLSEIFKSD